MSNISARYWEQKHDSLAPPLRPDDGPAPRALGQTRELRETKSRVSGETTPVFLMVGKHGGFLAKMHGFWPRWLRNRGFLAKGMGVLARNPTDMSYLHINGVGTTTSLRKTSDTTVVEWLETRLGSFCTLLKACKTHPTSQLVAMSDFPTK